MMTSASGGTMFGSSCTRIEYAARPPPIAAKATRTAASVGRVTKSLVIKRSELDLDVEVEVGRRRLRLLFDAVREPDDSLDRIARVVDVADRRYVAGQDVVAAQPVVRHVPRLVVAAEAPQICVDGREPQRRLPRHAIRHLEVDRELRRLAERARRVEVARHLVGYEDRVRARRRVVRLAAAAERVA